MNHNQPLKRQKHVPILLVRFLLDPAYWPHADKKKAVMWIAEIIAEIRGENLSLANNPVSDWIFDAHAKVSLRLYLLDQNFFLPIS
jgi:hypothetical protein